MADVTETYTLNFETNAQKATGLIGELERTLSEMGRSGELTGKGLNSASRGILAVERALGSSTNAVKKYSDSFSNLRKEVSKATDSLREAAQAYVVGGGTDVLGAASKTLNLDEAKEVIAIRKAESLTAEQVAAEVIAANKRKEQAQKNYEDAVRAGLARLERIQKDRTDEQNAAELRYHNQKMQRLQEEVRREAAAVAKIQAERAKLNQENAKAYQSGFTDPKSFFGQANSRDASTGLKASETSWAQAAKGQQAFREELNRTEISFQEQSRAAELSALKNKILARHTAEAGETASRASENFISLRYAMYDVGRTALTASAAITGTGVAALAAFGSQERAFTEVERIAEGSVGEVQHLRKELMDMSTEIPRSFQELSEIASLGGALGIDSTALDEFTNTVAKFVTLTGVTEEAATTGFGRISQYLNIVEEDYEKLGSSILRAGNISVATEEQVLKFSSAIALPASRAGLLADEVVALGAATASFANINVEGAGSAFSRVFANIERAVSEGGESLDKFAGAAGYSSEQFRIAWGSDAGGTFNRIIQGLSQNVDGLVGSLDNLGIRNERDRRVVSALALNYEDYMRIVGETTNAWREGIYMNEAYGLVLDDLVSKWTIFTNSLTNAAAAIGSSIAPAMKGLLDVATNTVVALSDFAQTPVGEVLVRMATAAGAAAAAILGIGGALVIAGASGLALRFTLREIAASGLVSSLRGVSAAIRGVGTASSFSAAASLALGNALKFVGRVTIVGAVLYSLSELIFNTREALMWLGDAIIWVANTADSALGKLSWLIGFTPGNIPAMRDFGNTVKDWGKSFPAASSGVSDFTNSQIGLNSQIDDFNDIIPEASSGLGDFGDSAGGAGGAVDDLAGKVYTLTDYASDLSAVWKRAFEIRFSGQQSIDTVRNSLQKLRDSAAESAKRVRDLKDSIRSLAADSSTLKSDINILEHYLKVAREYGDEKRATALEAELAKKRAELAKKTSELSDKNKELKKEQESQNKTLVGNSQAARDNRKTIEDLVQQYQAHIEKLAASGLSQAQLARETQKLKQDFIQQATQLGFNRNELQRYARAFDDVRVAIDKVPRNITVKANTNPAIQALEELRKKADSASGAVKGLNSALSGAKGGFASPAPAPIFNNLQAQARKTAIKMEALARVIALQAKLASNSHWTAKIALLPQIAYWKGIANSFATGGFTGPGGKYEPAGIVHRGEYVIPKDQVNQATGLPYASALGQLMNGIPGQARPAASNSAASGTATVALTAGTIQAIAQATGKNIYLDGKLIASSSSNVYAQDNTVGAY